MHSSKINMKDYTIARVSIILIISALISNAFADVSEDIQTNNLRKSVCLDGTWEITPPQRLNELNEYAQDKEFKSRWFEGLNNESSNFINVPLNTFYYWTKSKPVWDPNNLSGDPMEGCRSLCGLSENFERFFQNSNYLTTWYRKSFNIDSVDKSRRLLIYFGGVGLECEVFLNGKYIGRHSGGFSAFSLDITDYIQTGKNLIAVRCIIRRQAELFVVWGNGLNYYGGLWRSVYLLELSREAINKVLIDTQPNKNEVSFRVRLYNKQQKNLQLESLILENDSNDILASTTGFVPKETNEVRLNMTFCGKTWTPETPNLYRMKVVVSDLNRVLDEKIVRFGFRKFEAIGNKLYLNGNSFRFLAFGENGNHFGGEGYSNKAAYLQYKSLCQAYKKLGANSIRWHNQMITEQVRAADETGFAIYAGWASSPFLYENMKDEYWNYLKEYVEQYYNNPSILMWHFSNENWSNENVPLERKIYEYVQKLDTSGRPVIPDSGSYSFPKYDLPSISTGQFVVDMHNYSGVTFGRMGSSQKVAFTQTRDVVNDVIENANKILGDIDRPFILGECQAGTLWSAWNDSYWKGANLGGDHRKILGNDKLVRPEFFEELSEYDTGGADWLGSDVKHVGLISYKHKLYERNPVTGLASWTSSEIVKDCYETYRLMPISGMFLNQGDVAVWTPKMRYSLKGQTKGSFIFTRVMPIAVNLQRQVFSGSKTEFDVYTDNCTHQEQTGLQLLVRVDDPNGNIIYKSHLQSIHDINADDKSFNKCNFAVPSDFEGTAIVRLLLYRNEDLFAENFYHISVSPQICKNILSDVKKVFVWKPDTIDISKTENVLKDLGVPYHCILSKEIVSGSIDANWLIIPACAIYGNVNDENNANEWDSLVDSISAKIQDGLNVIVLEQMGEGNVGIIPAIEYLSRPGNVTADPTVFDHPVLAKVPWHKWWMWKSKYGDIAPYVMPLGINTLALIGAHEDDRLYSILSEGTFGKGRIILSQSDSVSRWNEDAAATLYLTELLHYALKEPAWSRVKPFKTSTIRDYAVKERESLYCINLEKYFNKSWSDPTPRSDGKGGWTDEGINDFGHFKPSRMSSYDDKYQSVYAEHLSGKAWMLGLPFIVNPEGSSNKACIVVGAGCSNEVSGIAIEKKAETIYFLGTATNSGKGKFVINYENGESIDIPSLFPDWWKCTDEENVRVAWSGKNPKTGTLVACYIQPWQNPKLNKKILSIDFKGEHLVLLGITIYRPKD
ncbi:MAG: hypothetical protein A2Y10_00385 [Planctomycetes bacterium GWF2_41_51]|nr:MAG: hypothetical protein A2Y10_00385 [Planctomycetes bacterium GWF2_41_51]